MIALPWSCPSLPWLIVSHQHELVEELEVALITTYASSLEELERHLAGGSLKNLLCCPPKTSFRYPSTRH